MLIRVMKFQQLRCGKGAEVDGGGGVGSNANVKCERTSERLKYLVQ